jgi:CDP-diacylglycerol--serine O-phosphatidyltransferase
LARYNVQVADVEKRYFQGLPIPLAAYMVASYILFDTQWQSSLEVAGYLMLLMTVGLALLMVSTVRYQSFKSINWKRRESFFVLVGMAVALFIVASAPSVMIFLFTLLYVISGLVEEGIHQIRKRKQSTAAPVAGLRQSSDAPEPFRVIDGKA